MNTHGTTISPRCATARKAIVPYRGRSTSCGTITQRPPSNTSCDGVTPASSRSTGTVIASAAAMAPKIRSQASGCDCSTIAYVAARMGSKMIGPYSCDVPAAPTITDPIATHWIAGPGLRQRRVRWKRRRLGVRHVP
jgi:hypothetical protein